MSDSNGKALNASFFAFASSFLQLLWSLQSYSKSLSLSLERALCKNSDLSWQHAPNGIFFRGLVDGKGYTDIHSSKFRVFDRYQKGLPRANVNFRIFRSDSRFCGNFIPKMKSSRYRISSKKP